MNVELKYFSGTGNSYKIMDTCKDIFIQNGNKATLSSITDKSNINEDTDLIGFCFPVYAFGIPRICRKYLLNLPVFKNPINTFILITAGDSDESGFCVEESLWGFIGAIILLIEGLAETFGFAPTSILSLPIALQEMVFACWVIVKGFNNLTLAGHPGCYRGVSA